MAQTLKISGFFLIKSGLSGLDLTRMVYTADLRKRMSEWQKASATELTIVGAVTTAGCARELNDWLPKTKYGKMREVALHITTSAQQVGKVYRENYECLLVRGDWYTMSDKRIKLLPIACRFLEA